MKIKVEDKTITRTFVQLDDFECELAHLYDVMIELGDSDLVLYDADLRDKLINIGVASRSVFSGIGITKGKKFDTLYKRIQKLYHSKFPLKLDDGVGA